MVDEQSTPASHDPARNPDGTWRKGFSGNPSGYPIGKADRIWAAVQGICRKEKEEDWKVAVPKFIARQPDAGILQVLLKLIPTDTSAEVAVSERVEVDAAAVEQAIEALERALRPKVADNSQ